MNISFQGRRIYATRYSKNEYPRMSITLAVLLLYMTPFVSRWLAVPAMLLCLYRVIRYDAKVFATDYCILFPISALTKVPNIPSLVVYLCLVAGIWYFLKYGLRASASFVILIILMNYLLTRMQMDINAFVLCFGQMFVLCVLLPKQDEVSVNRSAGAFINNLIISSVYAFALRNTSAIRGIQGSDSFAIWGTSIMRFKGLIQDPNYYMALLIIGLALLIKMKESNLLSTGQFIFRGLALAFFGVMTYSKTFFLLFVLLGGTYVLWQFWNKKVISGTLLTIFALIVLGLLLSSEASPFRVVIQRLLSAKNINDLTTGRSSLYMYYWEAITENLKSFFFGKGLAAEGLSKDPHNIYLEATYYVGTVGFCLITGVYFSLVIETERRSVSFRKQHFIARYVVLLMFLMLYFTLHGIFQITTYGELFLAILSLMITPKRDALPEEATAADGEGMVHERI